MSKSTESSKTVRIMLTEAQQQQIRSATGNEVTSLEFTAEQLEDRIAPMRNIRLKK
jgi:hypothetical protein